MSDSLAERSCSHSLQLELCIRCCLPSSRLRERENQHLIPVCRIGERAIDRFGQDQFTMIRADGPFRE
jgi:hypothetical protein